MDETHSREYGIAEIYRKERHLDVVNENIEGCRSSLKMKPRTYQSFTAIGVYTGIAQ